MKLKYKVGDKLKIKYKVLDKFEDSILISMPCGYCTQQFGGVNMCGVGYYESKVVRTNPNSIIAYTIKIFGKELWLHRSQLENESVELIEPSSEYTLENLNKLRLKIFKAKSADYNHGKDPASSFKRSAEVGCVEPHVYIKQMLMQKLSRLESYITKGQENMEVKDEGLLDTVVDMISYVAIHDALALGLTGDEYNDFILKWEPEQYSFNIKINLDNAIETLERDIKVNGGTVPTILSKLMEKIG